MQVKQAANVLELMEYFAERRRPATLAEISDGLGWPRSSTFNLVGTLVEKGYLYEPRPRAGYYPTPRWLTLAQAVAEAEPLPDVVGDLVADVAAATGETTAIGTLTGVHALFLAVAESRHQVRYHARVGDRVPIHASSAGRAILAQYPPAARQAVYRRIAFERFSDTTPMSVDTVEHELTEAGERGYHQSASEYIADLAGVALPLPLGDRRLSIVVAGPTSRCLTRRPETAALLKAALARHGIASPAAEAREARASRRRGPAGDPG
ncbi:IclR family transcriptional regulator [Methylobacterium aquaticum]|uniref:IclR family transcriptional regulator n=1 Tax=Methylobacterium aquaticum TaxID=270351 RepID=UPI003D17C188